jgi:hypothetical protein
MEVEIKSGRILVGKLVEGTWPGPSAKKPCYNWAMANDRPQEMNDEALAIIQRRRPDLKGKSLEEVRAILKAEHPTKGPGRPKRRIDD